MLYLGLMSGTSMDGVDAALMDVQTNRFLGGLTRPYPAVLAAELFKLETEKSLAPSRLSQLNTLIGREFADAALELMNTLGLPASSIVAIGSHGQTICHDAEAEIPYSLQLGCGHTIAKITGIDVVADFRTRDLVLGGKGAPFAPLYHRVLWGNQSDLALVNIGGISNMTLFPSSDRCFGYDLGPGNCLMDAWVKRHTNQAYDDQGAYAASGQIIPELFNAMTADPYFKRAYPKSLCKSYFSLDWLQAFISSDYRPQDIQASLLALTIETIKQAVLAQKHQICRLAICGGGVHNNALLAGLSLALPEVQVMSTEALGIVPDFLEAMLFAWLAYQKISGNKLDLSAITGASTSACLGLLYPKF